MDPKDNNESVGSKTLSPLQRFATFSTPKKAVTVALLCVAVLILAYMLLALFGASLSSTRSLGIGTKSAPGMPMGDMAYEESFDAVESIGARDGGVIGYPEPNPSGSITTLEKYETTSYYGNAHTREFEEACDTILNLKAQENVYFRHFGESENNCNAVFYTTPEAVVAVRAVLEAIPDMELSVETNSVSAQRRRVTSELEVLEERLSTIESTLETAARQYDAIAENAESTGSASELSQAITEKLRVINQLQNERVSISRNITQLLQSQSDLDERIENVEFSVTVTRAYAFDQDTIARKWERGWTELRETLHETMIGLTAGLGMFLLAAVQYIVYLLILIVIVKYLWRFSKYVFRK